MILESKILKGMMAATAKDDVRYYLCGVHVHDNIIEATNGHYLFRAATNTGDEERLFALVGNIPAASETTEINFDNKMATHRNRTMSVIGASYVEEIDGAYPDTDKLVSTFNKQAVEIASFSPEYMGLPYKLFKSKQAEICFGGENKMARIVFSLPGDISSKVTMYIMPMRM